MFLPTESLYAEVLRRPGLAELVQREFRIMIAGPATLAALLNSLNVGFQKLAIQKRSAEIWKLLGAVKTQFNTFSKLLESVQKKLNDASSAMEKAAKRE
ncbi:MAG: DNA recombination protein RmuC [Deltaproteobacteria bacterium]|nr:DNA recombination protein RmuC [Deltaproteobacteria bacterium]